jgi:putative sigma-54 modulation protein
MNTESYPIQITARHSFLTDALRNHVNQKLEAITRDSPHIVHAQVILDVQKYRHFCEVLVNCGGHRHFEAKAETSNMYASIEECMDKLAHQLEKQKEKWIQRRRAGDVQEVI